MHGSRVESVPNPNPNLMASAALKLKPSLTQRIQRVVIDGESSCSASVTSGIPQGTVLGPFMFLIYVNDITESASSTLRLFADNYLLYTVIKSEVDTSQLQCDLDHLSQWAQTWQMKLSLTKCFGPTYVFTVR